MNETQTQMSGVDAQLNRRFARRAFLGSVGALVLTPNTYAQKVETSRISVDGIGNTKIRVSDPARSIDWYQRVFGLPLIAKQGETAILQIGKGPQYLAIDGTASDQPGIERIGLSIKNFDAVQVLGLLNNNREGPRGFAVNARVEEHGANPSELFFDDPNGIAIHLHDRVNSWIVGTHGGGEGSKASEPSRTGVLDIQDFNHFTTFVDDRVRTVAFYRQLFHMPTDTFQGAMPLLQLGTGNQFLAFVGAGGRKDFRPFIHHVCFTVRDFDPDRVLKALASFGIKQRKTTRGPSGPLRSYVTMRKPDRGGAPGGTPELYFTDPDGILLQIQDLRYNGGSGYFGDRRGGSTSKGEPVD